MDSSNVALDFPGGPLCEVVLASLLIAANLLVFVLSLGPIFAKEYSLGPLAPLLAYLGVVPSRFWIQLGALAAGVFLVCVTPTRLLVRREQKDVFRVWLGGIPLGVLVRPGEARRLVLTSRNGVMSLWIQVSRGKRCLLVQSTDLEMVDRVAQEVAGFLSINITTPPSEAPLPPPVRDVESRGGLPFYMEDPGGGSRADARIRLQREPGTLRLEIRAPGPGFLAIHAESDRLVVPGLPENTARSLDHQVRAALRELRGLSGQTPSFHENRRCSSGSEAAPTAVPVD